MKAFLSLCLAGLALAYPKLPELRMSDAELQKAVDKLVTAAHQYTLRDSDIHVSRNGDKFIDHLNENAAALRDPTYKALKALEDNYDRKIGDAEDETRQEQREKDDFLDTVAESKTMDALFNILRFNRHTYGSSKAAFKDALKHMWMELYGRRSKNVVDSSGFEHAVIGEFDPRKNSVSGLHDWMVYYDLQKDGKIKFDRQMIPGKPVVSIKYTFDGFKKSFGSMYLGTPPEFEMAIGTLCFLARPGKTCSYRYKGCEVETKAYSWNGDQIASVFPGVKRGSKCQNNL